MEKRKGARVISFRILSIRGCFEACLQRMHLFGQLWLQSHWFVYCDLHTPPLTFRPGVLVSTHGRWFFIGETAWLESDNHQSITECALSVMQFFVRCFSRHSSPSPVNNTAICNSQVDALNLYKQQVTCYKMRYNHYHACWFMRVKCVTIRKYHCFLFLSLKCSNLQPYWDCRQRI